VSFADRVRALSIGKPSGALEDDTLDPETLASKFLTLNEPPEIGEVSWPRASSLYDACMRMHVLGTKSHATKQQWLSFKTRMLFGIGNAVHFYAQNTDWLFGDKRRGWWKCLSCRKILYFGAPPRARCPHCNAHHEAIAYYEHPVRLREPFMVTGHVDMFLERIERLRVVDFKTMAGPLFDKLKAPLVEHEWQVQTYMWGCSIDKRLPVKIDPEVGYIAYISKGYHADSLPLKMFPVKKSAALRGRIKAKLLTFKTGFENYPKDLPAPDKKCARSDFGSYQANQCPCKKECIEHAN